MMEQDAIAEPMAACEAALASLRRHGLAPTPRHYAVWYEFHAATNAPLRRTLDTAMAEGRPVDPVLMSELHDLHIAGGTARLAMREAGATLHEAAGQIIEAGHDAARYGRTLHQAAGEMGDDRPAMTALIARLVEVTTSLSMKSMALGRQLQSSSRRVSDLERQLATAHREALTDPLTGLLNRRAFDEAAREHAVRAAGGGTALSVLMLDIDHFKRVNDLWGHAVGDAVIRLVGATLVQTCRPPAQSARYGGEEFAVLMPGTTLAEASALAEQLRAALAARRISLRASAEPLGTITISVGAARLGAGETLSQWLGRADSALYKAKHEGRNRVVALAGSDAPAETPA